MFKFIFLSYLTLISLQSHAKVIEQIVAVVNNEYITQSDLLGYRKKLKSGGLVDEALLKITSVETLLKNDKALKEHLINERILDSAVKQNDLNVTFERVEKEIRDISRGNGISREELKKALQQKGIAFADYQDFIKSSIERRSLLEKEIISKIKISDDDITTFYISKRGADASLTFEYKIAHILILAKNDPESALERITSVSDKIKQNQNFEKLASQYSEDPNFTQGGLLGTFKAGEMSSEIESAVKNLKENQISKIVKTKVGYHIFKLLDKKLVQSPEFLQAKNQIALHLQNEAFVAQLKEWLEQKREQAFIRIN